MIYEIKGLSIRISEMTCLEFPTHLHHHIEMIYMLEGQTKCFVDSNTYILEKGDLLIIFPNQIHSFQKIDDEKSLLFIFPPELCTEYISIFNNFIPKCPLLKHHLINQDIVYLLQSSLIQESSYLNYGNPILKGYLLIILGRIFPMLQLEVLSTMHNDSLKIILSYCSNHYTENLTLDKLEDILHISKYHISHLFNDKLNLCFRDYVNMLRISRACNLLLSEESTITNISYSVGFNNPRSFNRAFIKHMSTSPRNYRKAHLPSLSIQ